MEPSNDVSWANEAVPLLGVGPVAPLWASLAVADYGVKLGKPGVAVENYAHRIFSRSSFKASLTQAERDLLLNS